MFDIPCVHVTSLHLKELPITYIKSFVEKKITIKSTQMKVTF